MKKFEYVWELKGQTLTGSKTAENEDALKAHIQELGGKLLSIMHVSEVNASPVISTPEAVQPVPVFGGPVFDSEEDIQRELRKWNWGAFFLTWIWGLGNGTWLALLSLLGPLNVPMMFLLGFKGNAWAWKHGNWRDLAHFRATQKKWAFAGLIFLGVTILFLLSAFLLFSGTAKKSEPYQVSLALAKNDAEVKHTLGTPIKEGFFVWGQSSFSPEGKKVKLAYSLAGPRDRATVYVNALLNKGPWEYQHVFVDLGKERRRINKTPGALIQEHSPDTVIYPESGVTKEDALNIAKQVFADRGWTGAFSNVEVAEDAEQGIWKVRTHGSADGRNAEIDIEQKTGRVKKAELVEETENGEAKSDF